jgi:hypothetical protein
VVACLVYEKLNESCFDGYYVPENLICFVAWFFVLLLMIKVNAAVICEFDKIGLKFIVFLF